MRTAGTLLFASILILASLVAPAAAELRFLPGDAASGPAIGTQLAPALAAGGGGYLAAWQEYRSSPFSAPPFTTPGRGVDIYAQRLDASGATLGTPIPIAIGFGDQIAPQVAWNGENWLVAWETPCECWSYSSQVQAVRVSPDGTVLDSPPIIVHTNASEWFRMTSNGSEWLVVLDSLRGIRVAASGELVNPGGTQMAVRETSGRHGIVSAQGEYLLAWDGWGPATARRFAADLTPIGSPFPIPSTCLASSGQDYFVIWDEQSTYWDDWVYGRRYSAEGVPGPTLTLAGDGQALPLAYPGQMAAGWGAGYWWGAWIERDRGVVFTRVTPDGTVLDFGGVGVDPTGQNWPMAAPAVAGRAVAGAQFIWQDRRADGGFFDILSAPVDPAGTPGVPAPVSTSARAQLYIDFAEGNGEIMAVFRSDHSGDSSIVVQRLDPAGNALDIEPIVIASGVDHGAVPGVGFDGTRYMVAWETAGQVYGRRVQPSGAIIDAAPISIMEGEWAAVAGLDGVFAVVTTQETINEHVWQPHSMRVDGATGALLDAEPVVIGGSFARRPRIIAFAGRWLATWQENFTHDNPASEGKAAFIESDGTTTGDFVYANGGLPDVAASGDTVLFVWRTGTPGFGNDIEARLMSADGTLAPETLVISADEEDASNPAVTWNGTEFVVAWTDMRNSLNYFDERKQVYAARVAPDGTVIDPAGFAFGDRAEHEIDPAVAGIGGRTLIAASSFRNEPEHGIYRFAYEVLGDPATGNRWPVAVASALPERGIAPLPVSFDSAGTLDPDGIVVSHEWDFEDGVTSGLPNPDHTYAAAANYLAQLSVTDDDGATARNVLRVLVEPVNQIPISIPAADVTSGDPPLSVVFNARDSYDPDTGIQNWEWDFGDGWDYWGSTAYHTFTTPGVYDVTLYCHDFRGATGVGTISISVGQPNLSPVAVGVASLFGGPAPLGVDFDGTESWDPDGTIVTHSWDFGDGNVATGATQHHVFATPGEHTVTLTVTDDRGGTAIDEMTVDVSSPLPFASRIGSVPDGESAGYDPLRLSKNLDGTVTLAWSDTCMPTDKDFAVYEGPLGRFTQHVPVLCSTEGLTSAMLPGSGEDAYYLVVAHDESYEGAHGTGAAGAPRPTGPVQCLPTAPLLGCP